MRVARERQDSTNLYVMCHKPYPKYQTLTLETSRVQYSGKARETLTCR